MFHRIQQDLPASTYTFYPDLSPFAELNAIENKHIWFYRVIFVQS